MPDYPNLPYRFCEFWVPKKGIFKTYSWPNIVGHFIKPIVEDEPDLIYWFVQEGPWFQFCYATSEPKRLEAKVRTVARRVGIRTKRILRGDTSTALAGDRWLSPAKVHKSRVAAPRSEALLRACHAACVVYVNALELHGRNWIVERNGSRQNPHGNIFESLMHLMANLSEARFDTLLQVRTPWMSEWQKVSVQCHL